MGESIGVARLWRALIALLVCACVLPAQGQAMELMTEDNPTLSGPRGQWGYDYRNQAWRGAGYIGARWVRAVVSNKVGFSWDAADEFVETATARDVQPYLTLNYAPANSNGNPSSDPNLLPIPTENEFGAYCAAAANRYAGRVRHYSVFNEPNLFYWRVPSSGSAVSRIPAATYGALFRRCATEIRAVDSSAKVYFGELTGGSGACTYLQDALTTSAVTVADGLAFHPYQWDVAPGIPTGRRCSGISSLGDWGGEANTAFTSGKLRTPQNTRVPLMVTEFGYCVTNRQCDGAVRTLSEQGRADWIDLAYRLARDSGLVSVFSYYHLVDASDPNWNSGIIRAETAAPSLAATALRNAAGTTDPVATVGAATNVRDTTATVNGTVTPNGFRTTYRFEYGETSAYGRSTPQQTVPAGGPVAVSASLTGLAGRRAHHFRLVVSNHVGADESADATFTTRVLDERPAVVSGYNGAGVSTFVTRPDGTISVSTSIGSRQSPWTSIGGEAQSAPAAVRRRDGTVDVFALWADGSVRHKTISPLGVESGWSSIGMNAVSAPAASLRRAPDGSTGWAIDVVARGAGGDVLINTLDTYIDRWVGTYSIGGDVTEAPSVMSGYGKNVHVVARATNGEVVQKFWDGDDWNGWFWVGGSTPDSPGVASWYGGNIEVGVRGDDGVFWNRGYDRNGWSVWQREGGQIDSAPALSSDSDGHLRITALRGGEVVQMVNGPTWGRWVSLGTPQAAANVQRPAVVEHPGGTTTTTFIRDDDGVIRRSTSTNGARALWTPLSGTVDSAPAATIRRDGTLDVFALISGSVQHKTISPLGVESGWTATGMSAVSAPAAALRRASDGSIGWLIDVVARGAAGDVLVNTYSTLTDRWDGAYSIGGETTGAPSVMSAHGNNVHVVARATNGEVVQKFADGAGWRGWFWIGGSTGTSPGVTSWYTGNIEVGVLGNANTLWTRGYDRSGWNSWSELGGRIDSAPAMSSPRSGQVSVSARRGFEVVRAISNGTGYGAWSTLGNPSLRLMNP